MIDVANTGAWRRTRKRHRTGAIDYLADSIRLDARVEGWVESGAAVSPEDLKVKPRINAYNANSNYLFGLNCVYLRLIGFLGLGGCFIVLYQRVGGVIVNRLEVL